jgi:hypothetical protein
MSASDDDFRMEQPNLTIQELEGRVRDALEDFAEGVRADLTAYRAWVQDVAPQIANYVALSTVDPAKAKRELDVLYGIAQTKAARLALAQTIQGQEQFGNYAILVARTLVRVLL